MQSSIGVNLRVTAHSNQGGRKYMEDMFCVAYQPTADDRDLLYAYFGIFDGHGGREAAIYAKHHLMDHIVQQKNFWSDDDDLVLKAIRDGFISTHYAMWKELDKWPRTPSGHPSTSGTTASIAFVRRGKLYIGHVGDSGIVLGYEDPETGFWKAKPLTRDHKPEGTAENARIIDSGGKVIVKSGVPRVVWNRPRVGHKGPVRRSTMIDEIPFLAVARSLGDLWSYNSELNEFVVSPEPDVHVLPIDVHNHRCLILGTDGLWNMLTAQDTVNSVYFAEKNNEKQPAHVHGSNDPFSKNWINPSKRLVDRALDRWVHHSLRADNTSVVCVVVDPPGPPKRSHVIRHSCSTMQDVASSPVGMSRYFPQDPDAVPSNSTRQTVPASFGSRPRHSSSSSNPAATIINHHGSVEPQSPKLVIEPTSVNKSQPSSRTTRVSRPKVSRAIRRATRNHEREAAAENSASPAQPDSGVSAFYPVSGVSSRTVRENHRNDTPPRNENQNANVSASTTNSSGDDVQIHEVSSSSERDHSKTSEDSNHCITRKRKGQKFEEAEKKRKVEDVRRPATRHAVAQAGLPQTAQPVKKAVSVKKGRGRRNQTKAQQIEIVTVAPRGARGSTTVEILHKVLERVGRQVTSTVEHSPAASKNATKKISQKAVVPKKVLKGRVVKKSANPIDSSKLAERTLRSSKKCIIRVTRTAPTTTPNRITGKVTTESKKKVKIVVIERSLRSTAKAGIRVTRKLRK